ncbi:hypothetical protein JVT61DRAFT_1407 [Boletus reticuloceps]|uniref:Uncharacterized protein n=1 Tax=Boletus reticuloceps TaxID=495285 RepID=A0A8I2YC25_9AGAM|nr:hypothetical protein JVT61DRAFT_1407 [Boletus reticuloceps]
MFYVNFDTNITEKYHVIFENWPQFRTSGSITSRNELHVLYHAFESDATHFRHLTDSEYEEWARKWASNTLNELSEHSNSQGLSNTGLTSQSNGRLPSIASGSSAAPAINLVTSVPASESVLTTTPDTIQHAPNPAAQPSQVVFSATGDSLSVVKWIWKQRSDKGKKWGPRQKNPASTPQVPAPTQPTSHTATSSATNEGAPRASTRMVHWWHWFLYFLTIHDSEATNFDVFTC